MPKKPKVRKVSDLTAAEKSVLETVFQCNLDSTAEVALLARHATSATNGAAKTCYAIAKQGRLIGILKHAPKDLSTHKKHMEGFGA